MTEHTDVSDVDLSSLALFAQPAPGRRRGTFSMGEPESQPTPPRVEETPRREQLRPRVERSVEGAIDWHLVDALRERVSQELSEANPAEGERQTVGRGIIQQVLDRESRALSTRGEPTWTLEYQDRLAQAIFDAVFRLGRFQPYLDDPSIENVIISGFDNVLIENSDGELIQGEPVADSDEALIEYLTFMAAHQAKPREFSESVTKLHMALPGRARLFATAWVTARPTVVIRRNRLAKARLSDLVDYGSLSPLAASFLSAVVQSRMSLVVSGDQGTGKTTMLRCLAHELPDHIQVGTIETEFELFLKDTGDHQVVHEWQSKPGSGEIGPDGRRAGEYTLADALEDSLRANLAYTIVGEVRGGEVVTMFKCMQSGSGSMSTTHARSAEQAIRKLVTCATQVGSNITREYALNVIAEDIDVIVQLRVESEQQPDGTWRKYRWVSEILAVEPGEEAKGYAVTPIFTTPPGQRRAVAQHLPPQFADLERYGFDLDAFNVERGQFA